MVPMPLSRVHVPVPGVAGVFPLRMVVLVGVQKNWSSPALASGADGSKMRTTTSSLLKPQGPLLIVHTNTFSPTLRPDTAVFGSLASAKVAVPLLTLHVPTAAAVVAFALSTVSVMGKQNS